MKKISVIIPVFNAEACIEKCLESILNQTYQNLEIICVNDGSTDKSIEIIEKIQQKDSRIKLINNGQNIGLFHTRLVGFDNSTGDYIAFVDNDDTVSIDFFRLLISKAMQENSDITCAQIVELRQEHSEGIYFPLNNPTITTKSLNGDDIFDIFIKNEGMFYYMQTMWNKLYARELWEMARPYYNKQKYHLVMGEDWSFSTVLLKHAKKFRTVENAYYFYNRLNNNAITIDSSPTTLEKNLEHLVISFEFMENFLRTVNYDNYKVFMTKWKQRYYGFWEFNLTPQAKQLLADRMNVVEKSNDLQIMGLESKNWYKNDLEEIKLRILDPKVEYVSFDIFDTLVVRPFYNPSDLFKLMNNYFCELTNKSRINIFSTIRVNAETLARDNHILQQDIDIDMIYDAMHKYFDVSLEHCEILKEKEISLEIRFCAVRNTVKELYDLALHANKKIIIISDMYLKSEHIKKILTKNGYMSHEQLYMSSDNYITKNSGALFKYVLKDLNISPTTMIHVGDNWWADIVQAHNYNINTAFIPKTKDVLNNSIPDIYAGEAFNFLMSSHERIDSSLSVGNGTMRSSNTMMLAMLGVAANKLFDNPFVNISKECNFKSIEHMGYMALGFDTLGVTKWLLEILKNNKHLDTVDFAARDGYLAYRSYNIIKTNQTNNTLKPANYIYMSRASLAPTYDSYELLKSLPNLHHIYDKTYNELFFLLGLEIDLNQKEEITTKDQINFDHIIDTQLRYFNFLQILQTRNVSLNSITKKKILIQKYFTQTLSNNSMIFDVGYRGSAYICLSELGFARDWGFSYTYGELCRHYATNQNNIYRYYQYAPTDLTLLRETFISDCNHGCIDYKEENNKVIPVLDSTQNITCAQKFIINTIQENALQFVDDFSSIFDEYIADMNINHADASAIFEGLMAKSKLGDMEIFKLCVNEDPNLTSSKNTCLYDLFPKIQEPITPSTPDESNSFNNNHINNLSLLKKTAYYYFYDREGLKVRVKNKLQNRPILFKLTKLFSKIL